MIFKKILICFIIVFSIGCQDMEHQYEIWDHRTNERYIVNGMPYGHDGYLGWPKNFYGFIDNEGFVRHIPKEHASCRKLEKINYD